jgi:hypothetical protein
VVDVSDIPTAGDVLDQDVELLPLSEVAQRLGLSATRIHQMFRDGQLLALRRGDELMVPAEFLAPGEQPAVVKGLVGTVTLLRDAGYADDEILRWLFTEDDTLPGSPIEALRSNRGREVKRRAQAMGF